jgi:CheY-like chemotaxis protein
VTLWLDSARKAMKEKGDTKKTIFVIDDDPGILEVITIILTDRGHNVVSISEGSMLFEELKKQKPDLMFLDVWISGSDGRDITRKLKGDKATKDIPIIIISALNETQKIAKEVGADGFLEKPFDIDKLLETVNKF